MKNLFAVIAAALVIMGAVIPIIPAGATDYDTPSPASFAGYDGPTSGCITDEITMLGNTAKVVSHCHAPVGAVACVTWLGGGGSGLLGQQCAQIPGYGDAYCPGLGSPYC